MTSVTAHAPGRVNLIGEHTDYNGGLCLPFALPLTTTATITPRGDEEVRLRSPEPGGEEYVAGVVWALRQAGWDVPGLDVEVNSDVPLGAGLSSSAALECAVAVAIAGLLDRPLDDAGRRVLAEACRRAETEHVGAPTGGLDQLASLLGAEGRAVLIDFTDPDAPDARSVPLPLQDAGLAVLVTDTRVRHRLAESGGGYAQRRSQCEAAAAELGVRLLGHAALDGFDRIGDGVLRSRARHVLSESERVRQAVGAVEAGDWAALGGLMDDSHVSLRDDFDVTTPELDTAVAAATAAGALGARMTGGGFGGSTIALVAEDEERQVRKAIDAAFSDAGYEPPTHRLVQPAAGALLRPEQAPG